MLENIQALKERLEELKSLVNYEISALNMIIEKIKKA